LEESVDTRPSSHRLVSMTVDPNLYPLNDANVRVCRWSGARSRPMTAPIYPQSSHRAAALSSTWSARR